MIENVEGFVIELEGEDAKIKLNKHGECSYCGSCQGDSAVIISASNSIGAKPGQKVSIKIEKVNVLGSAFIMFIFPILSIFMGLGFLEFISKKYNMQSVFISIFTVSVFFIGAILLVVRYDKWINSKNKAPIIIKILN